MLEENGSQPLLESTGKSSETTDTSADVPQASAAFRSVPNDAEAFGKVPQVAERKENHTLTVRETARMFESAGVARTERSIINWCQPNRQGVARLDSYFDPNERKYFITPQSVETAIQEELHRTSKLTDVLDSESFGNNLESVKRSPTFTTPKATDNRKVQELEREIRDLKITNRAKDMFIELLKNERANVFEKLFAAYRPLGQLAIKTHETEHNQELINQTKDESSSIASIQK